MSFGDHDPTRFERARADVARRAAAAEARAAAHPPTGDPAEDVHATLVDALVAAQLAADQLEARVRMLLDTGAIGPKVSRQMLMTATELQRETAHHALQVAHDRAHLKDLGMTLGGA